MANIQKRGDDSWFLTVSLGKGPNGKYIRRTKTVQCRTKREAESEYAKFRQEVEAGEYIAPQNMTFGAFVEVWREKYASKHLELKTMYIYESNLHNRILPEFIHLKLEDIKPLHIVNFLEKLSQEGGRADRKSGGLASGTIQINYRILKNILKRAVEWRIIKRNPATDVQKPKVIQKEIIPYDEREAEYLLQLLERQPYHWGMMITLALTTGLRRSELLGLEWKHIDWQTGVINVSQSMSHALKRKVIVKEPKTKNSKRKVALPASVLEDMRQYYAYRVRAGQAGRCLARRRMVFCV